MDQCLLAYSFGDVYQIGGGGGSREAATGICRFLHLSTMGIRGIGERGGSTPLVSWDNKQWLRDPVIPVLVGR